MSNIVVSKVKKGFNWIRNHKYELIWSAAAIGGTAVSVYVTAEFIKACKTVYTNGLPDVISVKPLDVQKTDGDGGWMLLDCYQPDLYWPITHGLNPEELQKVSDLVERENISTGQALISLGLLRANY